MSQGAAEIDGRGTGEPLKLSQAAAMTLLADGGFYVKVVVATSTQPPGTVISQSPSAGVPAYQTSTVTITVSENQSSPGG